MFSPPLNSVNILKSVDIYKTFGLTDADGSGISEQWVRIFRIDGSRFSELEVGGNECLEVELGNFGNLESEFKISGENEALENDIGKDKAYNGGNKGVERSQLFGNDEDVMFERIKSQKNKEVKSFKLVEPSPDDIRWDFTERSRLNNYINVVFIFSSDATDAQAGRAAVSKTAVSDGIRVQNQRNLDENPGGGVYYTDSSEIEFEKIASITPLPEQHVYDLSIEGTRNFIANDIIAHNTARYFQYKVDFNTTDSRFTPILNNVSINYTINSNLSVFDRTDNNIIIVNERFNFTANFTDGLEPINGTNINCTISHNGTGSFNAPVAMNFSAQNKYYYYETLFVNRTLATFNVTCDGTSLGYNLVQTLDMFNVSIARYSSFNGSTTNFNSLNAYDNVSNAVLEILPYGKIVWINQTNITGADFDRNVNISHNNIGVFAENLHKTLNSSANITISNMTLATSFAPTILRDKLKCPPTVCTLLNYTASNITFNVTSFSNYSVTNTTIPFINSNITIPTYPRFNQNVTFIVNVTDNNSNIISINFTLIAPNGTRFNLTNGSRVGDLHNSSLNLTSYGTWKWNVSVYDNDGFIVNMSGTGEIILMEVNLNLNDTVVFAGETIAVSGKINLSNSTNVSRNAIKMFLDEGELRPNNLTGARRNFTDDVAADFNLGTFNNTKVDGQNLTLANATLSGNLTTGLVAYWRLEENGNSNRLDSIGANHLVANSSMASVPGRVLGATNFTSSRNQVLNISDNTAVSTGDIDFQFSAWVNLDTIPASDVTYSIVSKFSDNTGRNEYNLHFLGANGFRFLVYDGTVLRGNVLKSFSPTAGTWYFVTAYHDATNNQVGVSVDNSTYTTAATTGVAGDGTEEFWIGGSAITNTNANSKHFFDGRIDEVGFWKRLLTARDVSDLYNYGNGITFPFNYTPKGNFTSRVFDAGSSSANFTYITWTNTTPANTSILVRTRTSADNVTFSDWLNHTASPSVISLNSTNRYVQYLVEFNTTNASLTPYIDNITVNYTGIFTDSFGKYNYTLTAPATAGVKLVKVNATWASTIPGEALTTFRVMSVPVINTNFTVPTYPRFGQNVTFVVNVTDADPTITYVNFTLIAPNGSKVINNLNGSKSSGDLYNTTFNLTSYGTWLWNVTVFDSDGFLVNTSTIDLVLVQINLTTNVSVTLKGTPVYVAGQINLSNGSNVSNNEISIYLNDTLMGLNNLTPTGTYIGKQFRDANDSDFNSGTLRNVSVYGSGVSASTPLL